MIPSPSTLSRLLCGALGVFFVAACDRGSASANPSTPKPETDGASSSSGGSGQDATTPPVSSGKAITGRGPGFAEKGPWVSFYGNASQMGDLAKVAATFRVINIDADPGAGNFTDAQLRTLKANGKNRVISYMNVGACENYRDYWSNAPSGFVSCGKNGAAHLGSYDGYPDETWMNPSNADYQKLIVEHVAKRLAARGVDGFYMDNLELLSHPASGTQNGPCNTTCRQGGLDLVRKLREAFPDLLIVMQNGTGDVTRLGTTGGVDFPSLIDGIAHEEVYAPKHDAEAERELLAWKAMSWKSAKGHPFWIAVEDYVGSCDNKSQAQAVIAKSVAHGFSSYVSDESGGQRVVCYF
jgi:cysteinyl-tRNA synthetase, unknown class